MTSVLPVVQRFELCWRDVANRTHQTFKVESVYPLQRSQLELLNASPGSEVVNEFSLVQSVDALGQGVVVGIADTSHRRIDPRFLQPLRVGYRDVLGGFNRSSQHGLCKSSVRDRRRLRPASSIRASCVDGR